jgi:phosphotransferase system enzyme I (PtsP)
MRTDVCSIYLIEPAARDLVLAATEGLDPAAAGKVRLDFSEGLVGLVATGDKPVNVRDASRHPRFKLIPECREERYRGFLGVPVIHRGETLGVIVVQQAEARRYRDTDVAFLVTLATQLAGVIALARVSGKIDLTTGNRDKRGYYVDAIAGAPGVAIGVGTFLFSSTDLGSIPDRLPDNPREDETAFRAAVANVVSELQHLQKDFGDKLLPDDQVLFDALAMMVSSKPLADAVVARIHAGNWAAGALRETIDEYASQFARIDDPYLRERSRDIRDLGQRILAHLLPSGDRQRDFPKRTILAGEDLGPIDLARVPAERLAGIVSAHGSGLSHLAILARAMGIPAIVGTADLVPANELEGKELVIDGYRGRLYINPGDSVREEYARLLREEQTLSSELEGLKDLPAETPDGFRVALYTNAGIQADLSHSRAVGSEGIGLYRTELPFMQQEQFPGEEEQRALYRDLLEAYEPRPVVLRTLDVGGDKRLPYFPVTEINPALGWRGIRLALDNPVVFITQLRAMIRASAGLDNLRILIPMISNLDEAEEALHLVRRTWGELVDEGEDVALPPCGFMIEVPSAVYQADALARHGDFLSVGTNDLTQYLLAVDRGNERVARLFESLHPAVIRALQQVVEAAGQHDKPVSVCGQAAGDPAMALLLLGMGIHSLSMSARDLPRIKSVIRTVTRKQAQSLLSEALQLEKAGAIRELLFEALRQAGLGGLIRAGK